MAVQQHQRRMVSGFDVSPLDGEVPDWRDMVELTLHDAEGTISWGLTPLQALRLLAQLAEATRNVTRE